MQLAHIWGSTEGLERYNESVDVTGQKYVQITEIVVPTEYDKQQLLLAFRYIHDLKEIDSGIMAVNSIMHLYTCPDMIKVAG